jgi:hypothetical protein
MFAAPSVGYRNRTPFCELCDEVFVDAFLKAFVVGGVDEEFAAVGLEFLDVF